MLIPKTTKLVGERDRISARDYNRRGQVLQSVSKSLGHNTISDSSGLHSRRIATVADFSSLTGVIRRAKIQTAGVGPSGAELMLLVKLLDSDGLETGSAFMVDCEPFHLGTNHLHDDVWPDFVDGDIVSCYKDINETWYPIDRFDDTTVCT